MQKKIVSVAVFAAMLFSFCIPSFSVSALDSTSDSGFYDTISELGLAETVLGDEQIYYYVAGKGIWSHDGIEDSCYLKALYIGDGVSFTMHSNLFFTDGTYQWSTSSDCGPPVIGSYYIQAQTTYYYDESYYDSGLLVLTDFYTNSDSDASVCQSYISNHNHITRIVNYSPPSGSTFGSIADHISGNGTSSDSSGDSFQLPDSWINGGETLPEGEIETFQGVDEDDALNQFDSLLTDSNSFFSDSSFLNCVGLFWSIIINFIDNLSAWVVVSLLMTFGLIAWVLGR